MTVVAFYAGGPLAKYLEAHEVDVIVVGKKGRWDVLSFLLRFVRTLRALRPSIVSSYLEVPNLVVGIIRPFLRGAKVIWNVRVSYIDLHRFDRFTRLSFHLHSTLARLAHVTIVNSERGLEGVSKRARSTVVRNGVDVDVFRPQPAAAVDLRTRLGIGPDTRVVSLPARHDPMKDHDTFLRAVALEGSRDSRYLCAGAISPEGARAFDQACRSLGIKDRVRWIGVVEDMTALYAASDIVTLSSYGEGFPNVLAEAMACGVPCVATDVGDAPAILGDLGVVVPPHDPAALAAGWAALEGRLATEGDDLRARCRDRMVQMFSLDRMVAESKFAYEALLEEAS